MSKASVSGVVTRVHLLCLVWLCLSRVVALYSAAPTDGLPETALAYLREFVEKYRPGTRIADVPSNRKLIERLKAKGLPAELNGQMILEVPVQINWQPEKMKEMLDFARRNFIEIRDVNGKLYNPR